MESRPKLLVVKRDKIGDLLLSTPMLAHLRASMPDSEIHVLASDYNAWVLSGNPAIDRLWVFPRVRVGHQLRLRAAFEQMRLYRGLRREHFDVALVAQGEDSPRALRRALWARARRLVGYVEPRRMHSRHLTDPLEPPARCSEIERILGLLAPLGIALPLEAPEPRFVPSLAMTDFANAWLAERGIARGEFLVIGVGARKARKRPSAAQALRWARQVHERWSLKTVLVWTPGVGSNPVYPGDDRAVEHVLRERPNHLVPYRGPVEETLGIVWNARASLFPDSGLMHFAAASPGGVLGLFAEPPEFVERWAPAGGRSSWLSSESGVAAIDDQRILAALERMLGPRRPERRADG